MFLGVIMCGGCWGRIPWAWLLFPVESAHHQRPYEWGEVRTVHWEVASEDIPEALIELGLHEYDESFRLILPHCYLVSEM